ncbi:hypothetical protein FEM48_Zijuj07G0057400 [Ziziphus jujuba var. spinosa]|uniref:rRNA adenine N(6)-methyltransferase n=1 Tax=Ziziphus jujuba var. spinosa TaxID=714518 RepID=A0A978V2T5_ZIZJJ|nr:hypothetical protein FEM48_Zijuj07G0057400 [Ziziphus jujuba var. spinosa]
MVDTIVQRSGIKSTDTILEIGLGTRNLTKKLLEAGKSVIAIEIDPHMFVELKRCFQGTPFSRRLNLRDNYDNWGKGIFSSRHDPGVQASSSNRGFSSRRGKCVIILFQREFSMRLVAQRGDKQYSCLTVNTQLLARVSHLLKVGRNNFHPRPEVDSSVVRIEPRKPCIKVNQWDRQICFNRNSRLGSIFKQESVLCMLDRNYKTVESLNLSQQGSMVDNDTEMDISRSG